MRLTREEVRILGVMVGNAYPVPQDEWGYRNEYRVNFASPTRRILDGLVTAGFAVEDGWCGRTRRYHATIKGCKAIGLDQYQTQRAMQHVPKNRRIKRGFYQVFSLQP